MYPPTKKDLIAINREIGETGAFGNESSFDFALSLLKQKKPWLQELAYIVRSLLVDHAFQDGNKRTALSLIMGFCEYHRIEYDRQKMVYITHQIAKKNWKDINKIVRLMENGIVR